MQIWGGRNSVAKEGEKSKLLSTPRTSCLKEKPEKLYIELRE